MIRLANAADAVGIAQVHVQSWYETYAQIVNPSILEALSIDGRTQLWQQVLLLPHHRIWVCTEQENIVGFLDLDLLVDQDDAEIKALYLLQKYQAQGLGKQLMHIAFEQCRQQHCSKLRLEVFERNKSRYFYEYLGAIQCGEEDASDYGADLKIFHYYWQL